MYEELITEGEGIIHTDHEKILVLRGNDCNLEWLGANIKELLENATRQDSIGIKKKLKEIVPEYQPFGLDPSFSTPSPHLQTPLQKPAGDSRRIPAM